jgi:4-alpha-glucanotransferase
VTGRRAGVSLPLFSARTTAGWGIGELADLAPLATWLAGAGVRHLMILPLGTMPRHETSPYSATSTLSIDPIYLSLAGLPDFVRAGGEAALSSEGRAALSSARAARAVDHAAVRRAKHEALGLAFDAFVADEWEQLTTHAASLAAYIARERAWLDDYALFLALADTMPGASWRDWPAPLRTREPRALDDARRQLARDVLRHQYCQWVAEAQWRTARRLAHAQGVAIVGDMPFVANAESPEVWARADEFLPDVSAGVPPDAFSATGQDWGLPTYNWDAIARGGHAWMRQRARRMAALYDAIRVDHVVGLYRTYGRPREGEPFFNPAGEAAQRQQGAAILSILCETGVELIAEDLGVVPDFVRASLADLGIPGCKVLRWERDWHAPGAPFLAPDQYPPVSVALTGTHDTEPMAAWWAGATHDDRAAILALPLFAARGVADPAAPWSPRLRDVFIELVYRSRSDLACLPVQDVFGWTGRVNVPGTVGPHNWTWCLPWPVDLAAGEADAVERAGFLRRLAEATGRLSARDYTSDQPPQGVHIE